MGEETTCVLCGCPLSGHTVPHGIGRAHERCDNVAVAVRTAERAAHAATRERLAAAERRAEVLADALHAVRDWCAVWTRASDYPRVRDMINAALSAPAPEREAAPECDGCLDYDCHGCSPGDPGGALRKRIGELEGALALATRAAAPAPCRECAVRDAAQAPPEPLTEGRRAVLAQLATGGPIPGGWHAELPPDAAADLVRAGLAERRTVTISIGREVLKRETHWRATDGGRAALVAPERHPLSQERSPRPSSCSGICGSCDGSGMACGGPCPDCDGHGAAKPAPAWRHDPWLSRVVSALHRAGFADRVPDCEVVDEDVILAALDDLVAVARSRS